MASYSSSAKTPHVCLHLHSLCLPENMKVLLQGAESRVYIDEFLGKEMIIKERFQKKYRISELDDYLTKERIKAECRNIVKCKQAGIKTPAIYFIDLNQRLLYMEYFPNATTVKDYLNKLQVNMENNQTNGDEDTSDSTGLLLELASKIGETVAKVHNCNVVHGDLTTSNILVERKNEKLELILIDFGLSSSEASALDKGVDLYVLERALISTHKNTEVILEKIMESYKNNCGHDYKDIMSKYEDVRARGRKRTMVG